MEPSTGLSGDRLVTRVLSPSSNSVVTLPADGFMGHLTRGELEGVYNFVKGAFLLFRNAAAHRPIQTQPRRQRTSSTPLTSAFACCQRRAQVAAGDGQAALSQGMESCALLPPSRRSRHCYGDDATVMQPPRHAAQPIVDPSLQRFRARDGVKTQPDAQRSELVRIEAGSPAAIHHTRS